MISEINEKFITDELNESQILTLINDPNEKNNTLKRLEDEIKKREIIIQTNQKHRDMAINIIDSHYKAIIEQFRSLRSLHGIAAKTIDKQYKTTIEQSQLHRDMATNIINYNHNKTFGQYSPPRILPIQNVASNIHRDFHPIDWLTIYRNVENIHNDALRDDALYDELQEILGKNYN